VNRMLEVRMSIKMNWTSPERVTGR
jgi:hypothetical protein